MSRSLTIHHQELLESRPDTAVPDPHQDLFSKTHFGFWVYLMTDCLLFATLFVTFGVLRHNTFGGPSAKELFTLPLPFIETLILLLSGATSGFALLSFSHEKQRNIIGWLAISFALGAVFITLELTEFYHLVEQGNSWTRSAFLSSFFTLVGTHGLHVSIGLIWMMVMMGQVFWTGVTTITFRRLVTFNLYWHFLDLVWIFIFTFVYLVGMQ